MGAGYDILSFNSATSLSYDRFIEVKSFHGKPHFYWSSNEKNTSELWGDKYYLYLVDLDLYKHCKLYFKSKNRLQFYCKYRKAGFPLVPIERSERCRRWENTTFLILLRIYLNVPHLQQVIYNEKGVDLLHT